MNRNSLLKFFGFAILDVFIAIVISLILFAGVLQVFLNSKVNSNLTTGFSQMEENSRFLDDYLTRIVRMAGYRTPPIQGNNFSPETNVFTSALLYVNGTEGTGFNGSDTLTIRYQGSGNGLGVPDGTISDCLNVPVDSNTMVTNTFSLTNNYELQCQALNANSGTPNNTQVLVSGVENFQVLYGEDLNGDFSPDRYVPANYPFINMNDVVAVRISVLLRSEQPVSPFVNRVTYNLLGTPYTTASDKYMRTQLIFTVLLRNLMTKP